MSSSDTDRSFRSFLERSFALMGRERPDAYHAMCSAAGTLSVRLAVDGERMGLRFERSAVRFVRPDALRVDVETTSQAILDAIAGKVTLANLAEEDRLEIVGGVEDVLTFHETLLLYVHGAVRAPSFSILLREFRAERSQSARS